MYGFYRSTAKILFFNCFSIVICVTLTTKYITINVTIACNYRSFSVLFLINQILLKHQYNLFQSNGSNIFSTLSLHSPSIMFHSEQGNQSLKNDQFDDSQQNYIVRRCIYYNAASHITQHFSNKNNRWKRTYISTSLTSLCMCVHNNFETCVIEIQFTLPAIC